MKKLVSITLFLFSFLTAFSSSVITDSAFIHNQVLNGIQNAQYIFEGEVIKTTSYYNEAHNFIYTANTIKIFQVWKNGEGAGIQKETVVEIITRGGTVGSTTLDISHQIGFQKGQKGLFLAKHAIHPSNPNTSVGSSYQFQLEDGIFFDYDYTKNYITAKYISLEFECIELLYEKIDTNYVADCLGVYPNGFLQNLRYQDFLVDANFASANVSQTSGTINYSFENEHSVFVGGKNYLEFDVYIASSSANAPTYLEVATLRINYNNGAFIANIVQNNKIWVTRGTVINSVSDYQAPSLSDLSYLSLAIGITTDSLVQNRFLITATPQQLIHIRMEITDCNRTPSISCFNLPNMLAFSIYATSPNVPQYSDINSYSYINANDDVNIDLCKLNIDNISPLNVIAGVNETVTITGNYFGNHKGVIAVKSANTGGNSWCGIDDYDIISWSDTEIIFNVPSIVPINATNANQLDIPGSGNIIIQHDYNLELAESSQKLTIDYSWRNYSRFNLIKGKVYLAGIDSVFDYNQTTKHLGYSFILDSNIFNNIPAQKCINKGLNDWTCATGIRWDLKLDFQSTIQIDDTISTMKFGTTSSSNVLAETLGWWSTCRDNTGAFDKLGVLTNIDINISNTPPHPWFYDFTGTISQPAGSYDFYSVILHELGHGHQLNHVNDRDDIMWFEAKFSATTPTIWWKRHIFFSNNNIVGGTEIVTQSSIVDYSYCDKNDYPMSPKVVFNCSIPTSTNQITTPITENSLSIYPNPFSNEFSISFNTATDEKITYSIYDLTGRIIDNKTFTHQPIGLQTINLSGFVQSGVYILIITFDNKQNFAKIIKN